MLQAQPLTKRARRQLRKSGMLSAATTLPMQRIQPLTANQESAFRSWSTGQDIVLHGTAGTGKTLMGFYFGLKEVLSQNSQKVIVIRSVVPSRDMGFLPGSIKEKTAAFEAPYYDICNTLFGRGDAYDILKSKGHIDFVSSSHLRGVTMDNAVIVVDEFQNMNWAELSTIMTRVGKNTRIIFSGDTRQSDLETHKGKTDVHKLLRVCTHMGTYDTVRFEPDDVVRSGKVKDFILTCDKLGY